MNRISVLVVDDSAAMRSLLTHILNQDPQINVVGTAPNADIARTKIKALNPDVMTLDIEMPGMDGLAFLEKVMTLRAMPVVMVSSMTQQGADSTMRALMLGAVDFIGKPDIAMNRDISSFATSLTLKVKAAAQANIHSLPRQPGSQILNTVNAAQGCNDAIIAIGASTGGVGTITELLNQLHINLPPVVIAQHIPPVFSDSFARRLNQQLPYTVKEAEDNEPLQVNHVYIAPGDRHLVIEHRHTTRVCKLLIGPRVNHHIPSVDVLFTSLLNYGSAAMGILLTGMGDDGARGLLQMKNAGAMTIAQDEQSSVVWGMPGAAVSMGAACQVLGVEAIASQLTESLTRGHLKPKRVAT
ncbi:MAG: chemotaxis response regulator protein-glutamate methylesterase [Pseudomonadales bacterium]|nr:chemotaxis response regulator protein-glutamate methylesterase [Pseudomonadales bacterium]